MQERLINDTSRTVKIWSPSGLHRSCCHWKFINIKVSFTNLPREANDWLLSWHWLGSCTTGCLAQKQLKIPLFVTSKVTSAGELPDCVACRSHLDRAGISYQQGVQVA